MVVTRIIPLRGPRYFILKALNFCECYAKMVLKIVFGSGVAKAGPGWVYTHPTYIPWFPKCLVCPVIWIKRSIDSNKTVKNTLLKQSEVKSCLPN